nr:reverse transcriptase domain-containing protein [Tanacetum cinerariifolium]
EPSSLFDFQEVMNNNHNQEPPPHNGPPQMVRPNGQDPQTIEELCQPSINGRGSDDANRHIDKFLEITQHMKQNRVSDDAFHLSIFPYSLTHHAITWREFVSKQHFLNSREDLKAITTPSGVTLARPLVSPPPLSKEVDQEPEMITDQVLTESTNNIPPLVVQPSPASTSFSDISSSKMPEVTKDTVQPSTENIQPTVAQTQIPIYESIVAPKPKPTIPYPSRTNKQKLFVDYVVDPRVILILGRPFLRTRRALIDVYGEELTLRIDDEAITFKVGRTLKYSYNDAESINRIDVINIA